MQKNMKKIVTQKLTEHVSETELAEETLNKIQEKLKKDRDITLAQQVMILKDKVMFHKACSLALQDVLDEIEKD